MKNKDLEKKYDEIFKNDASKFFTCNVFKESFSIVGMIDDWSNLEVLDLGCGTGNLASMVSQAGAKKVVGIDYSKEAIKIANEKFTISNLEYRKCDYKEVKEKFDVILLQGVLEHFDKPFEELKYIIDNNLKEGGTIITSSPSFLNPRGYVWMTLQLLFDVPMSLTDLHFICPFDFEKFCYENYLYLEMKSIFQDWGSGKTMIRDFDKRLRNALKDKGMNNSKVDDLLKWLDMSCKYFTRNNYSGAMVVYKIQRK